MQLRLATGLFLMVSAAVVTTSGISGPAPQAPAAATPAQSAPVEWRAYHRDLAGTRYAPVDAITPANVANLAVAWRWKTDNFNAPAEFRNESTPLMVNGTLYFTTGSSRWVVAADAVTGTTRWIWKIDEADRVAVAPRRDSGRGVAYWTNGTDQRIFTVTPGFQLVALDARTGRPVTTFGKDGVVDLKAQLGVPVDVKTAAIGSSSPPLVFEDFVVIGPALEVGTRPPSMKNVPGRILAMDAKTGAMRWRFNPIPQTGEE
jgi:quinoprotein glucose dehydrogenase